MPESQDLQYRVKERFLAELRRHLEGWLQKVTSDLSQAEFELELSGLHSDLLYSSFGLATPEYALVRLMGRISISIGRRLDEIYDKIPRFVTQARFGLLADAVAPRLDGLELDVCIPIERLAPVDRSHVAEVAGRHIAAGHVRRGLAIEIRYNFNPNDSARLRKDVHMAELLEAQGLVGIYLIFSSISPRDEAIARLTRAGWKFLIGNEAISFMHDLIGMDINSILDSEPVKSEVAREMARIMAAVYDSYAVRFTTARHRPQSRPKR